MSTFSSVEDQLKEIYDKIVENKFNTISYLDEDYICFYSVNNNNGIEK